MLLYLPVANVENKLLKTHGIYRECDICDDNVAEKRHPSEYLTDIHTDYNQTWWQSVTMLEDVHTQEVNLTVHLGKKLVEVMGSNTAASSFSFLLL